MTNADKIRALPNEILAEILWGLCNSNATCMCQDCPIADLCGRPLWLVAAWEDWLESEVEE